MQDTIANGPYNQSLRIQLALLRDIDDLRRRDEFAVMDQNRAQLELKDATILHSEQVRASVLQHLAQQKTITQAWGDGIISVYDQITSVVDRGIEKLTHGVGILDNLLKSIVRQLLNRVFQRFLDAIFPSSATGGAVAIGPQQTGGGGQSGGSFFVNLLGNIFSPRGGASPSFNTGGFAGGAGAAQFLGVGAGISIPASASGQFAQQSAIASVIHEAGHSGGAAATVAAALIRRRNTRRKPSWPIPRSPTLISKERRSRCTSGNLTRRSRFSLRRST